MERIRIRFDEQAPPMLLHCQPSAITLLIPFTAEFDEKLALRSNSPKDFLNNPILAVLREHGFFVSAQVADFAPAGQLCLTHLFLKSITRSPAKGIDVPCQSA